MHRKHNRREKKGNNITTPQEKKRVENRIENLERIVSEKAKKRVGKSVVAGMHP